MIDDKKAAGFQRQMSFKTYKKMKLRMLRRDFCINLTEEELARYNTLDTEIKVDQFCVTVLNNRWK